MVNSFHADQDAGNGSMIYDSVLSLSTLVSFQISWKNAFRRSNQPVKTVIEAEFIPLQAVHCPQLTSASPGSQYQNIQGCINAGRQTCHTTADDDDSFFHYFDFENKYLPV
jgi:hypothetical protein